MQCTRLKEERLNGCFGGTRDWRTNREARNRWAKGFSGWKIEVKGKNVVNFDQNNCLK